MLALFKPPLALHLQRLRPSSVRHHVHFVLPVRLFLSAALNPVTLFGFITFLLRC